MARRAAQGRLFWCHSEAEWKCWQIFHIVFHLCCVRDELCNDDYEPRVIHLFLIPPIWYVDMSLGWSPNVPLRLTTWFNTTSFMWYWDSDTECAITNLLVHSTEHPWIRAWDCFAETYENHWTPTMERAVMDQWPLLWIGDSKNIKLCKNSSWLQIPPLCFPLAPRWCSINLWFPSLLNIYQLNKHSWLATPVYFPNLI